MIIDAEYPIYNKHGKLLNTSLSVIATRFQEVVEVEVQLHVFLTQALVNTG
jgi:hypothetical protein